MFARLESQKDYQKTRAEEVLNPYVNFMSCEGAQTLHDSLVAEAIQMRGVEVYYMPREFVNPDMLFGEDLRNKFTKAWKIAAYLNSFEGYEGQNFFSGFGFQANDEFTITINPQLFKDQTNGHEPINGDLIYLPLDNSLFEINWVQPYDPFYQLGKNTMRKITAQKFIYSGEEIKPVAQSVPGMAPGSDELDLEPLLNLDGLHDTNIEQYKEVKQINKEADKFVDPYIVVNGKGKQGPSPFDEFSDF